MNIKPKNPFSKPGVYLITNSINGKRYVGSSYNAWKRYLQHKTFCKQGKASFYIQCDYDIYGFSVFKFDFLEDSILEDLRIKEQKWIDKLNPEYNVSKLSTSVKGVKRRPETIQKLCERVVSDEAKQKISKANKGRVSARKGVKVSEFTIEKMRLANFGKKYSDEVNSRKGSKGENNWSWGKGVAVGQYNMDGNFINRFVNAHQAAISIGKNHGSNITKCCSKKINFSYGYKWQFEN